MKLKLAQSSFSKHLKWDKLVVIRMKQKAIMMFKFLNALHVHVAVVYLQDLLNKQSTVILLVN